MAFFTLKELFTHLINIFSKYLILGATHEVWLDFCKLMACFTTALNAEVFINSLKF